jgi:hypothetical protein
MIKIIQNGKKAKKPASVIAKEIKALQNKDSIYCKGCTAYSICFSEQEN